MQTCVNLATLMFLCYLCIFRTFVNNIDRPVFIYLINCICMIQITNGTKMLLSVFLLRVVCNDMSYGGLV